MVSRGRDTGGEWELRRGDLDGQRWRHEGTPSQGRLGPARFVDTVWEDGKVASINHGLCRELAQCAIT